MSELFREIINYITNDYYNERKHRAILVKQAKIVLNHEYPIILNSKIELELKDMKIKDYMEFFKKIKEIRKIYLKGKSFVKNQTKGQKKGWSFRYIKYNIKYLINRNEIKQATENSIKHLEFIKKYKSKRTYFYHKKMIKELGIKIKK